jgi:putative ABC transport system permease protein
MLELKPIFNSLCRSKVGALLLLAQIAITTAIVSNAAFIINDRLQYLQQETGFPEQDIFKFNSLTFGNDINIIQQTERDEQLLRSLTNVIDAVAINAVPLTGGGSGSSFSLKPTGEKAKQSSASYFFVDEHAINTLGVELIAGRNFTAGDVIVSDNDNKTPNVAIITQAMADDLFPKQNALGQRIYLGDFVLEIIGIIDLMKGPWLKDERKDRSVLIPYVKIGAFQQFMVRTEPGSRTEVMKNIEDKLLHAYDKRVISDLNGLDEKKADYVAEDVLMMRMLIVIIVVLILVTALGIFGLTLFNISKRTKQIGTRRALGARKSSIVRYFILENSLVCAAGLILGAIASVLLGQQLMQLYSVPALSMFYVLATALSVFLISILAVIGPARRAANISPSIATRSI